MILEFDLIFVIYRNCLKIMVIENLLAQKKTVIVKDWFNLIAESYPADTSQFLKTKKDAFANPVGKTILNGLEAVFNELLSGMDDKAITSFLDPIIRIRAVQTIFSPSQATAFIFDLKKVVRKNFKKEIKENSIPKELLIFESKIDRLCLIAFDIYSECREKIYQLKVDTERNKIYSAFARAGLITDLTDGIPEKEPEFKA